MNQAIAAILSLIIGSVISLGAITVNTDDIVQDAKTVVNGANLHQLATVIEIYYSDHNTYPRANGGDELVNLLEQENYISNRPLDPSVFAYTAFSNGENYSLKLR